VTIIGLGNPSNFQSAVIGGSGVLEIVACNP